MVLGDTVPDGDSVEYEFVPFWLLLVLLLLVLSPLFLLLSLRNKGELVPEENLEDVGTLR